jgi:hypothetical protein
MLPVAVRVEVRVKPNDEMRDGERKTSEDTTDHL